MGQWDSEVLDGTDVASLSLAFEGTPQEQGGQAMYGASVSMVTPRGVEQDTREFSRIPVVIPVRVEILPASKEAVFAVVPGALLEIGRGGGRVRVRWEFPPRTRLFISLPVGAPSLRLLGEVIWASQASTRGPEPAVYGVRWVEPLSSGILQSVLLRQGLAFKGQVARVPGT